MEDRRKHIDDLFREGLNDYQETPGADIWTSLDQRLPAAPGEVKGTSYRWLWWLLLIALLGTVGYYTIKNLSGPGTGSGGGDSVPVNKREQMGSGASNGSIAAGETYNEKPDHSSATISSSTEEETSGRTSAPGQGSANNLPASAGSDPSVERASSASPKPGDAVKEPPSGDASKRKAKSVNKRNNGDKPKDDQPIAAETAPFNTSGSANTGTNAASPSNSAKQNSATNDNQSTAGKATTTGQSNAPTPTVATPKTAKTGAAKPDPGSKAKEMTRKEEKEVLKDRSGVAANDQPADKSQGAAETSDVPAGNNNTANKKPGVTRKKNNKQQVPASVAQNNTADRNEAASAMKEGSEVSGVNSKNAHKATTRSKVAKGSPTGTDNVNTASNKPVNKNSAKTTPVATAENKSTNKQSEVNADGVVKKEQLPAGTSPTAVSKTNNKKLPVKAKPVEKAGPVKKPAVKEDENTDLATTQKKEASTKTTIDKNKQVTQKNTSSKGAPITVTAESSKKEGIDVAASNFKKKPGDVVTGESFTKDNMAGEEETTVTKSGIRATNNASARKQKPEPAAAGINISKYVEEEAKEEARMAPDEVDPAAAASIKNRAAGGSGIGGESPKEQPRAELRNFNNIKLSGGLKAGYDRGFGDYTTSNFVFSPYLQWNISPKFALVLQPGFRYNQVNKTSLLDLQSYHQITSQSLDSSHVKDSAQQTIQRNYAYRNTYDSITAHYQLKPANYWEVELPLYMRLSLTEQFSIFAGGILSFGKIIQVEGDMQRITGLQRYDSLSYPVVSQNAPYPNPPSLSNYFSYNTPVFTATPENYSNPTSNPARFGILVGFGYEFRKRLMIDVLYRQNVSDMKFIPNDQVRKIYTQPYFRISIGYKLFDTDRKK